MVRNILFGMFLWIACLIQAKTPIEYVNPLMGTESVYSFSHGNTYPAVAVPWGMNFWSPQTGENGSGWMYSYQDTVIRGFRQTHQPSPWINDYGTFSIMPVLGKLKIDHKERGVEFLHQNEKSTPAMYQVTFENGVTTAITSSSRGAVFEISYPASGEQYLVIDAFEGGSGITIDKENSRVTGYAKNNHGGVPGNFANYFVLEFSHKPISSGVSVNGRVMPDALHGEHNHVCAYLQFDLKANEKLEIRTASSFISHEQAVLNLEKEIGHKDFKTVRTENEDSWNSSLGRILVEEGDEEDMSVFYSCLYRTLLFPREFYEFDQTGAPVYYSPYDGKVHQGYMYTDNGFWDTFRAVHPLFTLVYPEVSERIMESLLNVFDQSGFLPEWCSPGHRACMIGNNSLSLLTDAWMKGIRSFDEEKALNAMINQTTSQGRENSVGRHGFEEYHRLGYVPYPDYNEATAKTLEYAYADWCLARFADSLGRKDISESYFKKSQNYRNLFDPSFGFMRAKNKHGRWIEPFNPVEWGGPFTEGCSWHYTWSVFHDVKGLSDLMGGNKKMVALLDSMFTAPPIFDFGTYGFEIHEISEMVALNMGQYAHGNQPVQHAIYLYNYLGEPWKTQYHVRNVLNKLYNSGPKGYCGDEDNGQTSAWYVFSALGFYPVCPGVPQYVMGSPLFQKVKLNLPQGKEFVIQAEKNAKRRFYIEAASLNNMAFNRNYLTHDEIRNGGILKLKMSDKPNKKRGIAYESVPYSYSR